MSKIMTEQVNINMKLQRRLSVGLAAATLVVALLFFAGSVLLNESWFAALVMQTGITLESFVAVFAISAIVLSTGAFVISWKHRSFLGAGLLATSGVIFMIHPLTMFVMHFMNHPQMASGHSAVIPGGPILVVILGLGILGLGVVMGIRTSRIAVAAARQHLTMTNSKLVSKKVLVPAVIIALSVGLIIWGLPQAIAATINQTINPRAPGSYLVMPNITGSVALGPTMLSIHKAIASQVHVSLSNASVIAEKAVGANSHAAAVRIGVVHGFLVYMAFVVDSNNNFHGVLVDSGNGKVLSSTQVPMAALMRGGMGMMGPGMGMMGPGMGMMRSGMLQGMMMHGFGGFWHGPFASSSPYGFGDGGWRQ